jgi:hypothetical protein
MLHQRNNIKKILISIHPVHNHIIGEILVLFIYVTRLVSNEIFSPSNKILMVTLIPLPALLYTIQLPTIRK